MTAGKSTGIWIIAMLLLAYGSFTAWLAISQKTIGFFLWTAGCYLAAGGLLLARPWSRYLVYFLAASTVLGWAVITGLLVVNGWRYTLSETLLLAAHGAALVSVCIVCSAYVYRYFRSKKPALN